MISTTNQINMLNMMIYSNQPQFVFKQTYFSSMAYILFGYRLQLSNHT